MYYLIKSTLTECTEEEIHNKNISTLLLLQMRNGSRFRANSIWESSLKSIRIIFIVLKPK